jgi:hypothetical protein
MSDNGQSISHGKTIAKVVFQGTSLRASVCQPIAGFAWASV